MKIKGILIILVIALISVQKIDAQTATIETVNNAVSGQNYVVDVYFSGFTYTSPSISCFQGTIHYDLSKLTFVNLNIVTPIDGWVWYLPPQNPGKITFVVVPNASFNAVSNTLICQLEFTYNGPGNAFVNWSDNPTPRYIYDDYIEEYFNITWVNGGINEALGTAPLIYFHPVDTTINEGQNAVFTVAANGTMPMQYSWQISQDGGNSWSSLTDTLNFTGTSSDTLTINAAHLLMSGFQFRAVVSNAYGIDTSNAAELTVLPLTGLMDQINDKILIYPNPVDQRLDIWINRTDVSSVSIMDLTGSVLYSVAENKTSTSQAGHISVDVNSFPEGIYLLQLQMKNGSRKIQKFCISR